MVLELLESGGYEGVRLREVALRAQVSLTTVYKTFPTRNELIVAALEQWLAVHADPRLRPAPAPEPLYDGLMRIFRHVLEPWTQHPPLLAAWVRAQREPGGHRLLAQATAAIEPASRVLLDVCEPVYADDIAVVLTNAAHGLVWQFANGAIGADEILPGLERTVFRLTADNRHPARRVRNTTTRGQLPA